MHGFLGILRESSASLESTGSSLPSFDWRDSVESLISNEWVRGWWSFAGRAAWEYLVVDDATALIVREAVTVVEDMQNRMSLKPDDHYIWDAFRDPCSRYRRRVESPRPALQDKDSRHHRYLQQITFGSTPGFQMNHPSSSPLGSRPGLRDSKGLLSFPRVWVCQWNFIVHFQDIRLCRT